MKKIWKTLETVLERSSSAPTKYELMVVQYIQKHLHIPSLSDFIIDYIKFKGILNPTKHPFGGYDYVTPLLDGRIVYFCSVEFKLKIWNPDDDADDNNIQEIELDNIVIVDIQTLKDGRLIITCYNKSIIIINPYTRNYDDGIGFKNDIIKIKLINNDIIMIVMSNNNIYQWNIITGQCVLIKVIDTSYVYSGIVSEQKIVESSFSDARKMTLINLQTGESKTSLEGHSENINRIYVLSNGYIVSTSTDKTIKLWNITDSKSDSDSGSHITCGLTLVGHTDLISDITVLPDGRLVSGSYDQTIKIWNMKTGNCELNLVTEYSRGSVGLTVLPDGGLLACYNFTNYILWM